VEGPLMIPRRKWWRTRTRT